MNPFVSVLVPTHNRRHYLPLLLKWYDEQDYMNKELVILDDSDCSNADLFVNRDDINYNYVQRTTIGAVRNFLNQIARGDIFVCMDDDDYYAPHYVSTHVKALMSNDKLLMSGVRYINQYDAIEDSFVTLDTGYPIVSNCCLGYKKQFYNTHSYNPESKSEEEPYFNGRLKSEYYTDIPSDVHCSCIHGKNTVYELKKRIPIYKRYTEHPLLNTMRKYYHQTHS